jgi:hypothetical protein
MTDDELLEYSHEHVSYELSMFYETAARLERDPKVHDDWLVRNALLESFTIHARAMAGFLFPDVIKPRPDDVTALHYVRDPAAWPTARGPAPDEVTALIARTGKEIAHLTRMRHPSGAPEKAWTPALVVRAFFSPLRRFLDHAAPERLDIRVTEFIAALPDDRDGALSAGSSSTSEMFIPPMDASAP